MIYAVMVIYKDEDGVLDTVGSRFFDNWNDAKKYIDGKNLDDEKLEHYLSYGEDAKIRFKKFETQELADKWVDHAGNPPVDLDEDGVYFDAGTGGGKGVRCRVTDVRGFMLDLETEVSLVYDEDNNIKLEENRTNNYGELFALYLALQYALANGKERIFGDSMLVIKYWSMGKYNKEKMTNTDTIDLIEKTSALRKRFAEKNGRVYWISGDRNPADLGYHK